MFTLAYIYTSLTFGELLEVKLEIVVIRLIYDFNSRFVRRRRRANILANLYLGNLHHGFVRRLLN